MKNLFVVLISELNKGENPMIGTLILPLKRLRIMNFFISVTFMYSVALLGKLSRIPTSSAPDA